jgi:hypothetical protein
MDHIYICKHCGTDLDDGDILEHFLKEYNNDYLKAMDSAKNYGWSETNRIHFDKSVIIQFENSPQCTICPECKRKNPFPRKG